MKFLNNQEGYTMPELIFAIVMVFIGLIVFFGLLIYAARYLFF